MTIGSLPVDKKHDHKISPATALKNRGSGLPPTCPIESHMAFNGATSSSRVGKDTSAVKPSTNQKKFLAAAGNKPKLKEPTPLLSDSMLIDSGLMEPLSVN
jgi:hypothetical protein